VSEADAVDAGVNAGPGAMLRRAREARGLSEQQAAEQLNLDASVVAALERDELAALGAPVFAKGHLRRYGAMLGVAEDELLAAYGRAGAQPEVPTLVPRARQEMVPVRGRPKWPWVTGGALLFLLAAGLAAYVSEYGLGWPGGGAVPAAATGVTRPDLDEAPAAPDDAAADPRGASAATSPGADAAQAAALAQATAETAPLAVPQGHVSISLAFATDSWAEVYDGSGQAVLYDLGRAGTQRSIAAAAPLRITIGNAPGVTLVVNGRPSPLPAVPGGGTVARFRIEADGSVR